MKILIISRTPWNNSNSFGNTFSNLFGGMKNVEIYNICCQNGSTENDVVARTLQMSEMSLLRALKGGSVKISSAKPVDNDKEQQAFNTAKRHKSTSLLFVRDALWKLCSRKWKRAVREFIAEVKPDVLYLPTYASLYMGNLDEYAIRCARVPVVSHITDDEWNYSPSEMRPSIARLYKRLLRRKMQKLMQKVSYIEVFAEEMKREYEQVFHVPCYVIGKGITLDAVHAPRRPTLEGGKAHFVYTGGIGGERYDILLALGRFLERQSVRKSVLDIYTATPLTSQMKDEFAATPTICYHGAVSGAEVVKIQAKGDYLVHVEGFSPQAIHSARLSFSTKIIDYLSTGNVLLAIGPAEVNSIKVVKEKNVGIVVDDVNAIDATIERLLMGDTDTTKMQQNAYEYLTSERLLQNIQKGMYERLTDITKSN